MSPDRRYPLELDQAEVERYRTMADAARQAEADLWEPAGIVAGARAADVGCGPGAMLPALAAAVGPGGQVAAVDADPEAVAAATVLVAAAGLANVAVREGRAEETGLEAGCAARGDDNAAGLHLAERVVRAGLELVEFRGRYVIRELSPGLRSPAWAAREAMVAAGMATSGDLRRWERAFEATARRPATFFAPMFTAIGRRSRIQAQKSLRRSDSMPLSSS